MIFNHHQYVNNRKTYILRKGCHLFLLYSVSSLCVINFHSQHDSFTLISSLKIPSALFGLTSLEHYFTIHLVEDLQWKWWISKTSFVSKILQRHHMSCTGKYHAASHMITECHSLVIFKHFHEFMSKIKLSLILSQTIWMVVQLDYLQLHLTLPVETSVFYYTS